MKFLGITSEKKSVEVRFATDNGFVVIVKRDYNHRRGCSGLYQIQVMFAKTLEIFYPKASKSAFGWFTEENISEIISEIEALPNNESD